MFVLFFCAFLYVCVWSCEVGVFPPALSQDQSSFGTVRNEIAPLFRIFLFEKKPKPSTFVPSYLRCISVCLYPGLMKAGCVCLLRSPINVCQPAAVAFVRRYQYPVGRASAGAAGIVVLFSYSAHLKEKDVNEEFDWKRCLHSPSSLANFVT